jgi:hypothetical protein
MKAITRLSPPKFAKCDIFFCYEDYEGNRYGNYDELIKGGLTPYVLCGYLYSYWFNASELIDEKDITRRPTRTEVAEFITHCKKVITD